MARLIKEVVAMLDKALGSTLTRMPRRAAYPLALVTVLGLTIALVVCGGAEGPKAPKRAKDGRIFIKNDVGGRLNVEASYLDEELSQEFVTVIKPGETEEVTRRAIKGGTEVTVRVHVPGSTWRDLIVKVKIDGTMTLRVFPVTAWGSGELGYEVIG